MFKEITEEDFKNMELERLLKKEFEDEIAEEKEIKKNMEVM